MGSTEFAPGKWVGVELEEGQGKNNGSVNGKEYFKCSGNRGLFVRPSQLQVSWGQGGRAPPPHTCTHTISLNLPSLTHVCSFTHRLCLI